MKILEELTNKEVLVTGGCGFIGSNLGLFLKSKIKKAKVTSVDKFIDDPGEAVSILSN